MGSIVLDLQFACDNKTGLPNKFSFQQWLEMTITLSQPKLKREVTVRLVDEKESHELNLIYRGINKPTNVLSFPFYTPPGITQTPPLLGDIIICRQIIELEAIEQNITTEFHWAHVVIHGMLHLLGFNHIEDNEAEEMELLEKKILFALGYSAFV